MYNIIVMYVIIILLIAHQYVCCMVLCKFVCALVGICKLKNGGCKEMVDRVKLGVLL